MNAFKKADVAIGAVYVVRLHGGASTQVRIDGVCPYGGWYGTNLATGREVRIKSAAKLRKRVESTPA